MSVRAKAVQGSTEEEGEEEEEEGTRLALTVVEVALPVWGRVMRGLAERSPPPAAVAAASMEALPEDISRVSIPKMKDSRERRVARTLLDPSLPTPGGGKVWVRKALLHCS